MAQHRRTADSETAYSQPPLTFKGLSKVGEEAPKALKVEVVHLAIIEDLGWDISLCKESGMEAEPENSPEHSLSSSLLTLVIYKPKQTTEPEPRPPCLSHSLLF